MKAPPSLTPVHSLYLSQFDLVFAHFCTFVLVSLCNNSNLNINVLSGIRLLYVHYRNTHRDIWSVGMLGVSGWRHILDPKEDMSTAGSILGCMSSKMKLASMDTLLWFITSISRTIFLPTFTGPKSKDFWQPSYKSSNRGTPGAKYLHESDF